MLGPEKISVGAPFFNRTFVPIMVPLFIAVSLGAVMRWKRDTIRGAASRVKWALVAVLVILAALAILAPGHIATVLALALAAWLVLGALAVLTARIRLGQGDLRRSWDLARTTPRAVYGMVLAHAGLGLLVAGIACVTAWEVEEIVSLPLGGTVEAGPYQFTLQDVRLEQGPNLRGTRRRGAGQ